MISAVWVVAQSLLNLHIKNVYRHKLDGRFHARLFTHLVLKNRKSVVTITQSLNALLFWFPIMFKTNLFLGFKFINTFVFALQFFNCYPFFHFTVDWVWVKKKISSRSVFIDIVKLHLWYNSFLSTYKKFCFQLWKSFLNPDVIIKFSIYINKYNITYSAKNS